MTQLDHLADRLRRELPELELRQGEPMSCHTTFRVGGPAALMALPRNEEELLGAAQAARGGGIAPLLVGNGSNLLVDDQGVDAFVIKTAPGVSRVEAAGNTLCAGAGISLAQLAVQAAKWSLTGLEFAHGIPGSLGGAVVMNAGAYGGEMCQVIGQVRAMDAQGRVRELAGQDCAFSYRHSLFSRGDWLVLEAVVELAPGDPAVIRARMEELMARRKEKQPLEYPSAGSTFKRPQGHFAAALIEQCGLKGLRVGGAQVSEKHAGFIINTGGATCRDILTLMDQVRERVFRETGVELEPEVKYVR